MLNKRKTERYLKQAKEIKAPERVWENIKNEPISITEKPQKNAVRINPPGLAIAAAVMLVIISLTAVNQKGLLNNHLVTEEITVTETENQNTQPTNNQISTTIPSGESVHYGVFVPVYKVWDNRLYIQEASNASDDYIFTATEEDLNQKFTKTINGFEYEVYSLKNVPIEEKFAWKANNVIYLYDCIYNGMFEINDKKYGLAEEISYFYPSAEKGKYIGTVDGMKVYEFFGNEKAVIIDMMPIIDLNTDEEYLFVAELVE